MKRRCTPTLDRTALWSGMKTAIAALVLLLSAFFVSPPAAQAQSTDRNNPTPLDGADIYGMVSSGNAGSNYYFSFNAEPRQVTFTLTVEGGFAPGTVNGVSFEVFDERGRSLTNGSASALQGQSQQFVQRLNINQRQRLLLQVMIAPKQIGNGKYTLRIGGSAVFGPPLVPSNPTTGSGPIAPSAFRIGSLSWLTGCWQSPAQSSGETSSERWSPLAGQMMMGVSQTVKNNSTTRFEFLRIVQEGASVSYIAKPAESSGETSFKLIKLTGQEAIFENPNHDFPQRVIYRRTGERLAARIEGNNNGRTMGFDFPMVRMRCE